MLLKLILKRFSIKKQANFMKSQGIVLGTRMKNGRRTYLYMVSNLFAEILYENDNPSKKVEALIALDGLNKLNTHLEAGIRN